ncbi:MAG: hypothetical protein N2560_09775 [Ignavibacteria bacterium]|nr:hypothetical protein [Ignavibacteria bacterium]
MKKFFVILFLFFFPFFFVLTQDNLDNVQFEESNVQIEKPPYFGLGGGYVGNFLFIKLDEINNLCKSIGIDEIKSPMFISGAQGFTAIGLVPNLRVGFSGYSGIKKSEKQENFNTKGMKFEIEFTSFAIDYGIVLFKSFAILPGVNFGWSKITLNKYLINKFDWNDLKSNNYSSNIVEGKFWFVQPGVNVEFAATPFLMLRLGVAYPFPFGAEWKLNDVVEVTSVPNEIKPQGFVLNFGIFVGLFNY